MKFDVEMSNVNISYSWGVRNYHVLLQQIEIDEVLSQ